MMICSFILIILLVMEICAVSLIRGSTISDSAWTFSINGNTISTVTAKPLSKGLKKGETLTCTVTLPECDFVYPALVFEKTRSRVTVTNAGKTLFSSEEAESSQGYSRALINQISLRNADFSQPIVISLTAEDNNSIFFIPSFQLTEQRDGFAIFIKTRIFTFFISLFLFFIGLIGTVICSASRFLSQKLKPLITLSLFTLSISIYSFCHLSFILVFIHNDILIQILELVSFYLTFILLGMILLPKLLTSKKHIRLSRKIALGYVLFSIVTMLLPLFTSLSILDTFSITVIPYVGALLFISFLCIKQWCTKPDQRTFTTAGFLMLFTFAVTEFLRILLYTAGVSALSTPEMMLLGFGVLIFVACSLIDYFIWFKNSTIQETVEESWKRFSEPNSEPGISGYQKTIALLSELQDSKTQYTIITISIDNIDELKLSPTPYPTLEDNFARLIHLVFSSYGITGNLGKGKFLAALPAVPEGKVKQLLMAFKVLVKRDNDNHPEAKIAFSTGYALSTDTDDEEIVKVCMLANNSRKVQEQQLLK